MDDDGRTVKPGQDVSGDDAPFLDDEDEAALNAAWERIRQRREARRAAKQAQQQEPLKTDE